MACDGKVPINPFLYLGVVAVKATEESIRAKEARVNGLLKRIKLKAFIKLGVRQTVDIKVLDEKGWIIDDLATGLTPRKALDVLDAIELVLRYERGELP